MKNLFILVLFGLSSNLAMAEGGSTGGGGFDIAYLEFDGIRGSDLPKSEKTSATFEYMADIYGRGGKPLSLIGCFASLDSGVRGKLDPCLPIMSRESGGGTGGGGAF